MDTVQGEIIGVELAGDFIILSGDWVDCIWVKKLTGKQVKREAIRCANFFHARARKGAKAQGYSLRGI